MTTIKNMVAYVTKSLADEQDKVEIEEYVGESTVVVELRVSPVDMGRIIGRRGRNINAMRAVARVLGQKSGKRTDVKLIE